MLIDGNLSEGQQFDDNNKIVNNWSWLNWYEEKLKQRHKEQEKRLITEKKSKIPAINFCFVKKWTFAFDSDKT